MSTLRSAPAFGEADLSNCERELIHLAGSIQPHGALLVLRERDGLVLQASANCAEMVGIDTARLIAQPVSVLRGDLAQVAMVAEGTGQPQPFHCHTAVGGVRRDHDGMIHRQDGAGLIVELEPASPPPDGGDAPLQQQISAAVSRFSGAATLQVLSEAVVQCFRDLAGYDRVMVYKFDPDGHGEVIAEARADGLESFLGLHYPATDIPQRARELYMRNRARVLVDVHYEPVPIVPRESPASGSELDMSLCHLRSMSPLHLQYLKNMGVTGTLVVSLVRGGALWGLIACHHYSPLRIPYALRAASELLAEVISTRIAAIENYAHAQVAIYVRRLEQRLVEATATDGDWRMALFSNPRTLLLPLHATGAALCYEGEIRTAGDVPSTPELRMIAGWVAGRASDGIFHTSSIIQDNPDLASVAPTASGIMAIALSTTRPDFLMWFRKEQLRTVTWAGDPGKAVVNDDPLELSPRRSFAAWSQIVSGTAASWSDVDVALARAIGGALVDIILQIHAVRLLIAQHQLSQVSGRVESFNEPTIVADSTGRVLLANDALLGLLPRGRVLPREIGELAELFVESQSVAGIIDMLRTEGDPWRGELTLRRDESDPLPVAMRADLVPGRGGTVLGYIVILTDLSGRRRAEEARRHLEHSLRDTRFGRQGAPGAWWPAEPDEVIAAILSNASLAALDIADGGSEHAVASVLEELESSTRRAATLYAQLRAYLRASP